MNMFSRVELGRSVVARCLILAVFGTFAACPINAGAVGSLSFSAPGSYPAPTAYTLQRADFNGDGKPDIAVTYRETDKVSVLLGLGDGTFAPRVL